MLDATAGLDERMREGIARVGSVDVLVGIPSYNNAGTIGHVTRTVASGLRQRFAGLRAVIVNADGGSRDGSPDMVVANAGDVPAVAGAYRGLPGKGSAFRAIFEAARATGARACAVVDSDLRSITPDWVARLLGPILEGAAEYVTPLYARHKHDGTITNTIAYPLTRALYGWGIRQPIGGEFGFAAALVDDFLSGTALVRGPRRSPRPRGRDPEGEGEHGDEQDVWQTDVARFGIDIYMTTTALVTERRVAQAFLGAKVHDPKDPGADLAPMFGQVVGTAFRLAAANREAWSQVTASRPAPVIGEPRAIEPEAVNADVALLRQRFAEGRGAHEALWREVLGEIPERFDDVAWARIVYGALAASAAGPARTDEIVLSLVPLYFARVARFIEDARQMSTAQAEALVDAQARAFEAEKGRLRERLA